MDSKDINNMNSILVNGLFELFPFMDENDGQVRYWITDADKAVEDFGTFSKDFVDSFIDASTGRYDSDALEKAIHSHMENNGIQWTT